MNNIDIRTAEHTPIVYIASIDGDADGATKTWLRSCIATFAPHAVSPPAAILVDSTDYDRLSAESLNEFLVDADVDAVVWATAPDMAGTRLFRCAVSRYPKVKHKGREANTFTVRTANAADPATAELLAANILGAALTEIADTCPASPVLIGACIHAMETGLTGTLEHDLYLLTLDRLQSLYFAVREDENWDRNLRRAIDLNERLCCELENVDTTRFARRLKDRASYLAVLGARTGEVADILAAITALKKAAPHFTENIDRARLDMTLANCKSELGLILDDTEILLSACDLLRSIIPVLYRNLDVQNWAMAQANLGAACWNVYRSAGEPEHAIAALDAMHEALTVYNPKAFPLDWAMAKNNLGSMLSALGDDPENIDALYRGIDCLRDALTIYTRDKVPMDYAMTSANLAESLCVLALHTNDTDHLKSAEQCFSDVLRIFKRSNDPKVADIEQRLAVIRGKILLSQ
ncbi:hypothetical protein L2D14_04830 [Thalassospiraceae bacterium LMO-JJ14]|nr:hypothetical protein L2D14_04830 [Thalassospiraceae bacterium LMO-JJ14]